MRAAKADGSATASSSELVCSDCVPPSTAARASIVVRTTLLKGSCSVRDQPLVWQCVRSSNALSLFGENLSLTSSAQSLRAARSFAIYKRKKVEISQLTNL